MKIGRQPTVDTPADPARSNSRLAGYWQSAIYIVGVRTGQSRYWELDILRAVAIVWMVIFHLLWDLMYFNLVDSGVFDAYVRAFGPPGLRPIFFVLVGVSLSISYQRAQAGGISASALFQKYLVRGLIIFAWGMIITLTVLIAGTGSIDFGTLHAIGVSIVIAFPLLYFKFFRARRGVPLLILGVAVIAVGLYIESISVPFVWLLWLGFKPNFYSSLDYFPLLPWFGVVSIGIFLGNLLYTPEKRLFPFFELPNWRGFKVPLLMGSNALLIYLVHQPILYFAVYLIALAVN